MADMPSSQSTQRSPKPKSSSPRKSFRGSMSESVQATQNGNEGMDLDNTRLNGDDLAFTDVGDEDKEDWTEGSDDSDDGEMGQKEEWEKERYDMGERKEEKKDYYAILNVPKDVTLTQLRTAYHDLSLTFHPDKQPPKLRASATQYFNLIKKAYETLSDPRKRIAYDLMGEEGANVSWDVGVKAMTPEEFKVWLMNKVRRARKEKVENLVASMGIIVCTIDGRGLFGQEPPEEELEKPEPEAGVRRRVTHMLGSIHMARYFIQHTFHVPLPRLMEGLNTPLDPMRVIHYFWQKTTPKAEPEVEYQEGEETLEPTTNNIRVNPPHLRISASIGGTRVVAVTEGPQGKHRIRNSPLLAQPNLEFSFTHAFPPSEVLASINAQKRKKTIASEGEKKYPCIASIMQSCQVSFTHQVLSRITTLGLTRPILNRKVGMNIVGHFVHGRKGSSMPSFEATFSRGLSQTGAMFFVFGTGNQWSLKLPFIGEIGTSTRNRPGNGSAKIGYTSRQSPGTLSDVEDDDEEFEEEEFEETNRQDENGNEGEKIPKKTNRKNANQVVVVALTANQLGNGLTVMGIGLDYARTFFAKPNPPVSYSLNHGSLRIPNSARGIRIALKTGINLLGELSCSISGTRAVGEFSRIGIELSIGGAENGLLWSFTWRRLGQKISIPILVSSFRNAEDIVDRGWNLAAKIAFACFSMYAAIEFLIIRRREDIELSRRRKMRKFELAKKMERDRREAESVIELMKETILRRQAGERVSGGLVILFATYGVREESKSLGMLRRKKGKMKKGALEEHKRIDVTVPVGALVEGGQLIVRKGVKMAQLRGFYDPAPYQPKTLEVHYLFRGVEHRVEVDDRKGLVIPSKAHAVEVI